VRAQSGRRQKSVKPGWQLFLASPDYMEVVVARGGRERVHPRMYLTMSAVSTTLSACMTMPQLKCGASISASISFIYGATLRLVASGLFLLGNSELSPRRSAHSARIRSAASLSP
jgi:hypothetical protein